MEMPREYDAAMARDGVSDITDPQYHSVDVARIKEMTSGQLLEVYFLNEELNHIRTDFKTASRTIESLVDDVTNCEKSCKYTRRAFFILPIPVSIFCTALAMLICSGFDQPMIGTILINGLCFAFIVVLLMFSLGICAWEARDRYRTAVLNYNAKYDYYLSIVTESLNYYDKLVHSDIYDEIKQEYGPMTNYRYDDIITALAQERPGCIR